MIPSLISGWLLDLQETMGVKGEGLFVFFFNFFFFTEGLSCGECRAQMEQHCRHPADPKSNQQAFGNKLSCELPLISITDGGSPDIILPATCDKYRDTRFRR